MLVKLVKGAEDDTRCGYQRHRAAVRPFNGPADQESEDRIFNEVCELVGVEGSAYGEPVGRY